jgi:hypothetical protein
MRDPKRITSITRKLARYWRKYPDMRFTQLLWAFFFKDGRLHWSLEDADLEKYLDALLR